MVNTRIQLDLRASIAELPRLKEAVEQFCARIGLEDKLSFTLQLVCDEWVTNIITHGYEAGQAEEATEEASDERPIAVTLECTDESVLVLTFEDRAAAFNPLEHPEPDVTLELKDRKSGGLGIHFMKKMMDHCEYERLPEGNRLILVKQLHIHEEAGQDGIAD
jgi:anti-sigma regulatory factor (Ser/Thr protein kinase)